MLDAAINLLVIKVFGIAEALSPLLLVPNALTPTNALFFLFDALLVPKNSRRKYHDNSRKYISRGGCCNISY